MNRFTVLGVSGNSRFCHFRPLCFRERGTAAAALVVTALLSGSLAVRCRADGLGAPVVEVRRVSAKPVTLSSRAPALAAAADSRAPTLFSSSPTQIYGHGNPTAEEQLMLELINRARANPAAEAARFGIDLNEGITNDVISPNPKQPLAFSAPLIQAARAHSQWMLDNDSFEHFEGAIDPQQRMAAAGYVFSFPDAAGENIVWRGTTGSSLAVGPTVALEHQDLFVDETVPGRGHRLVMMAGVLREIGVGVALGFFTDQGRDYNAVMTTQDFGATGANPGPFLVGVVYQDSDGGGFYSVGEGAEGVTVKPDTVAHYAVTSASGGYAIPLGITSGALQVTFSGGALAAPVTRNVTLTSENQKLDLVITPSGGATFGFVPGSLQFSSSGSFETDLFGPLNSRLAIQSSDDQANWIPVTEIVLTDATAHFVDPQPTSPAQRFYRAIEN